MSRRQANSQQMKRKLFNRKANQNHRDKSLILMLSCTRMSKYNCKWTNQDCRTIPGQAANNQIIIQELECKKQIYISRSEPNCKRKQSSKEKMAQVLDLAKRQFKRKARMPWVKIQNAQKCMYKSIKQLQMYSVCPWQTKTDSHFLKSTEQI